MRQMLAVFRKDVRGHWPQLAAALMLTALTGLADLPASSAFMTSLLDMVWIACWIYLVASFIQQERLVGDRQYWLTRPYDWRVLLGAKVLVVIALALLPLIAVKAAMLASHGISPPRHTWAILVSSLVFIGAFGLPAGALAAVTETLAQFLWGLLALIVIAGAAISFGENYAAGWGIVAWVRSLVVYAAIAIGGVAVLLLQYRSRRSFLSRVILLATALLTAAAPFGRAWHAAWRLESRLGSAGHPEMRALRLSFDASKRPRMRYADARLFPASGHEGLYLPIRVSGLPAGAGIVSQRVDATIEGSSGNHWSTGWQPIGALIGSDPRTDIRFIQADGPAWQYLDVDRTYYQAIKNTPVRIRISVALALLANSGAGTVEEIGRTQRLGLDGICEVRGAPVLSSNVRGAPGLPNVEVSCSWPRPGPERAYVRATSPSGSEDVAPLTPEATAFPSLDQSVWRHLLAALSVHNTNTRLTIETWQASGYPELSLDISGVRLSDYAAPRATDPE